MAIDTYNLQILQGQHFKLDFFFSKNDMIGHIQLVFNKGFLIVVLLKIGSNSSVKMSLILILDK